MSDYLYENKQLWYEITRKHWEQVDGTYKGMLGGNDKLNEIDLNESKIFIENYISKKIFKTKSLLELGAGVGRVTMLLKEYFEEIYLVEQSSNFVNTAKENLKDFSNVKEIINKPMQETFSHESLKDKKFNIIWIQWSIENLDDSDLINLLKECKSHLEDKGCIFIKENVVEDNDKVKINDIDYSRVRNDSLFKEIFVKAGLKIFKHTRHPNWPKDFMDVSVFILM